MKLVLIVFVVILVGLGLIFHTEVLNFFDSMSVARATQTAIENGDYDEAIAKYGEQARKHPANLELSITLADLYAQKGDSNKAASVYQEVLQQDPNNLKARLGYGNLMGQQPDKMNQALTLYRKIFRDNTDNPQLMTQIGDVFRQAADNQAETRVDIKHWLYDWAIYYYRIASRLNPKLYSPHFNLGVVYQENKQMEKSANRYCNALLLNSKSYAARYNLGLLLIDMGDYDQAYREMNEAVHLLADSGSTEEAHTLAEQVQTVKNMVFNANQGNAFGANNRPASFLNPACLVKSAPMP